MNQVKKIDFKRFRQNINFVMKADGCTFDGLAILTDIKPERIHAITEDAIPTIQELCALCSALVCSIDDMLYKDARPTIEFVHIIRPDDYEKN